jgi:hypothetical protein
MIIENLLESQLGIVQCFIESSVIFDSFFGLSKHAKWKNLSPRPKFSPSSSEIGVGLFMVSGKNRQRKAPARDKTPSTSDGNGLKIVD